MKNDHRSKFSNLSNWKEEAWKNQGFNGIRTRDLRETGAMLYQLSYEATHWERGQFIEFISPVRREMGCLWGSAWRPFGPPELRYNNNNNKPKIAGSSPVRGVSFGSFLLRWLLSRSVDERQETVAGIQQMARKFPPFRSERKKEKGKRQSPDDCFQRRMKLWVAIKFLGPNNPALRLY